MWGFITSVFLGVYLLVSIYIGSRGWTTIGKPATRIHRIIFWASLAVLVLSFPFTRYVGGYLPEMGEFWFTIWGWYSMLAVVYIFLLLLCIDLLRVIDKQWDFVPSQIKAHTRTPKVITTVMIIIVGFTLIYGTWNAQNPIVTNYEIAIDKKAGSLDKITIAMVADIHYGEIINSQRLEKLVEIMQQIEPDIILLAGDIMEGTPNQQDADKFIEVFKRMNPKYGKVAVPGNHDRWLRTDEGRHSFQEAGIALLRDERITIEDSFYIIGRDDPGRGQQRKGLEDLMEGLDPLLPIILLDHQPLDILRAQENNVDIQLAGHTHRGQIFPANFITGYLYELHWGILTVESYNLIVTNGYGTWGPPLRIGNRPEIVNVTVNFGDQP